MGLRTDTTGVGSVSEQGRGPGRERGRRPPPGYRRQRRRAGAGAQRTGGPAAPAARRARSAGGPPGVALEPRLPGRPSGASGRRGAEREPGCSQSIRARVGGEWLPRLR